MYYIVLINLILYSFSLINNKLILTIIYIMLTCHHFQSSELVIHLLFI